MVSPRVLVLESHSFQRNVMVMQLQKLGMSEVLDAEHCEQAMARIELLGCIDIVLCDLSMQGGDALQFLRRSSQAGMVRSVVQCGELGPELRRGLGQLLALMGVRLLGNWKNPCSPRGCSGCSSVTAIDAICPGPWGYPSRICPARTMCDAAWPWGNSVLGSSPSS